MQPGFEKSFNFSVRYSSTPNDNMATKRIFFLTLLICCISGEIFGQKYGSSPSSPSTNSSTSPAGIGFPTSNNGCFPNIIKNPVPSDSRNKVGVFYEARSKTANQQVYNALFTNTPVGKNPLVWMPATTTLAVHLGQNYQHVTLDASGNPVCSRQDLDYLCRLDGVCFLQVFDAVANGAANPMNFVQYYLYTDESPKGWEIVYTCVAFNTNSGMCDQPFIVINTRVHPNQMSAADKSAMDAVIDQTLKPYCMTKADLQTTIFRTDIPACNAASEASFTSLTAGWDASLAHPDR